MLLMIGVILATGMAIDFYSKARFYRVYHRINEKVISLFDRRPPEVSPESWEKAVAWAGIAAGNILFSETYTSYEAMCKFETQLDEKLKGEIGIETMHWIGKRLEETGPSGDRYMNTSIKWWKQWDRTMEKIERERKKLFRMMLTFKDRIEQSMVLCST